MSITTQEKENIFRRLTEQYGFVQSQFADSLYVSPATGALLYWDGELMELSFGLCEKFEKGAIIMQ